MSRNRFLYNMTLFPFKNREIYQNRKIWGLCTLWPAVCSYEDLGHREAEIESGGAFNHFSIQTLLYCWLLGFFFLWVKLLSLKHTMRIITDFCLFQQTAMTLKHLLEERLEIKYTLFQSKYKPTSIISEEDLYSSCFKVFGQQRWRGRSKTLFFFFLERVPQMCSAGRREYLQFLSPEAVPWGQNAEGFLLYTVLLCVKEKLLPYSTFSSCHFKENHSCVRALGSPVLFLL